MLHLNEKKMAAKIENWKKRKRERKDRTTDAPVVVVVPRIFPFPFQRRALLRSCDPHNVLVLCCCLLFIVVLIIIVVLIMWSVVLHNQKNKTEK